MKYVVLGAGLMGRAIAYDLGKQNADVVVCDISLERAEEVAKIAGKNAVAKKVDVSNKGEVVKVIKGSDAVVSAVTYYFNADLAEWCVESGVNFCDLGGNNEIVKKELALDARAKKAGITIVPDCGLAPGTVSILASLGYSKLDETESIHLRVGGLPQKPKPPLNYGIVFSLHGLINEYVEKALVLRNGKVTEIESMTELESISFKGFPELEAFVTSGGTSTLPETFAGKVKALDYKTIRYKGHAEKIKLLIDLGLGSQVPIEVGGCKVRPREVLIACLSKVLPTIKEDVVLLRAIIEGKKEGKRKKIIYEMVDKYDKNTDMTAMMRTTAYPASITAIMMANGKTPKGAIPPEKGVPGETFLKMMKERGIFIEERIE